MDPSPGRYTGEDLSTQLTAAAADSDEASPTT